MWEKEIFIRHFSDKEDRISGGLKKSPPGFYVYKRITFQRGFWWERFFIMVSEQTFYGKGDKI